MLLSRSWRSSSLLEQEAKGGTDALDRAPNRSSPLDSDGGPPVRAKEVPGAGAADRSAAHEPQVPGPGFENGGQLVARTGRRSLEVADDRLRPVASPGVLDESSGGGHRCSWSVGHA